jgi:Icc-related predicted phosphoesterase
MKIQIMSDIHLEFGPCEEIKKTDADVVVLAGDIHTRNQVLKQGLEWIISNFGDKEVVYVLGNHEYWGNKYPKIANDIKNKLEVRGIKNIHVLENESVIISGTAFHGATLWTDMTTGGEMDKLSGMLSEFGMNDFKYIRMDKSYRKIEFADFFRMHKRSLNFLKEALGKHAGMKNVVVTHHCPSRQSLPFDRESDALAQAYVSSLEGFIKETKPDCWIHGHVHMPCDYDIFHDENKTSKTRVVCNPRGYPMNAGSDNYQNYYFFENEPYFFVNC